MAEAPLYVIDASTSLKWYFTSEPGSIHAARVLIDYRGGSIRLVAPPYYPYEVLNVVRKHRENREISRSKAREFLQDFQRLQIPIVSPTSLFEVTGDLAFRRHLNVYDAGYAALAQLLGTQVIAADRGIVNALGSRLPLAILLDDYRSPG